MSGDAPRSTTPTSLAESETSDNDPTANLPKEAQRILDVVRDTSLRLTLLNLIPILFNESYDNDLTALLDRGTLQFFRSYNAATVNLSEHIAALKVSGDSNAKMDVYAEEELTAQYRKNKPTKEVLEAEVVEKFKDLMKIFVGECGDGGVLVYASGRGSQFISFMYTQQ